MLFKVGRYDRPVFKLGVTKPEKKICDKITFHAKTPSLCAPCSLHFMVFYARPPIDPKSLCTSLNGKLKWKGLVLMFLSLWLVIYRLF